ncbi:uncharacterized protein TNCV_2938151 [Trichonephila clavipes]|nr:uncharacterized protein TNCV_2938151 [Trichonephila clavipes]
MHGKLLTGVVPDKKDGASKINLPHQKLTNLVIYRKGIKSNWTAHTSPDFSRILQNNKVQYVTYVSSNCKTKHLRHLCDTRTRVPPFNRKTRPYKPTRKRSLKKLVGKKLNCFRSSKNELEICHDFIYCSVNNQFPSEPEMKFVTCNLPPRFSKPKLGLDLDMDNGHRIIMQSYHICQLTCSLKFPVFRRICTGIIFDHIKMIWIMILLRQSRERNEVPIEGEALGPGPVGPCLKMSLVGLAIHQNDHQARRRFVEWAQNEIAVVPDFHKRILFSDEAHFWLNGYVNKQNCRIWSQANPQVYVETPLHPEKLTVWCALWAGGIIGPYFFKNDEGHNDTVNGDRYRAMITNFFIP